MAICADFITKALANLSVSTMVKIRFWIPIRLLHHRIHLVAKRRVITPQVGDRMAGHATGILKLIASFSGGRLFGANERVVVTGQYRLHLIGQAPCRFGIAH